MSGRNPCSDTYYNKCTQGGLVRYYSEIAECTKLLIIMQCTWKNRCNILPETAAKIFKEENVVAIKEATGRCCTGITVNVSGPMLWIDLYSGRGWNRSSAYGDRCDRE